jgi:hypothetical protein
VTDDTPRALVKASTEGAAEGAVRAALEPFVAPVKESGLLVTDLVRFQRWKVQLAILRWAKAHLDDLGIPLKAVPLKVLIPLLEGASLEDEEDEDMISRWTALLENAAAGEAGAPVSPAFPKILSELAPAEAALLDHLASTDYGAEDRVELQVAFHPESRDSLTGVVREHPPFDLHLANLERLGLCEVSRSDRRVAELEREVDRQRQQVTPRRGGVLRPSPFRVGGLGPPMVTLTDFGSSFVAACKPPTAAQTAGQEPDSA